MGVAETGVMLKVASKVPPGENSLAGENAAIDNISTSSLRLSVTPSGKLSEPSVIVAPENSVSVKTKVIASEPAAATS